MLIARAGSVGRAYRIKLPPENSIFASYLIRLRAIQARDDYLAYFFQSPDYWSQIQKSSAGITLLNVNASKLADLNLPLPPLPEQRRIVDAIETHFSRLDAGTTALENLQIKLDRYRAAVLKAACEGTLLPPKEVQAIHESPNYEPADQLLQRILTERRKRWVAEQIAKGKNPAKLKYEEPRPPDTENLPPLPAGWLWVCVGQIANARGGKRLPKGQAYSDTPTEYPYIRVTDFDDFTVSGARLKYLRPETRDLIERYTISEDDVYISIAGTIGEVGTVPTHLTNSNLTENAAKITHLRGIDNTYLSYALGSPFSQAQIARFTVSSNQPKLALFRIEKIPVPLPPLSEQVCIVEEIERRLSLTKGLSTTVAANLRRADRLRQSILKDAFAGRLVPQDPNDEPASVLLKRIQAERERRAVTGKKSSSRKKRPRKPPSRSLPHV